MARNCAKCGAPLKNDDVICMNCGAVAEEAAMETLASAGSDEAPVGEGTQGEMRLRPVEKVTAVPESKELKLRPVKSEAPRVGGVSVSGRKLEDTQALPRETARTRSNGRADYPAEFVNKRPAAVKPQYDYCRLSDGKEWGMKLLLLLIAFLLGLSGYQLSHNRKAEPVVKEAQVQAEAPVEGKPAEVAQEPAKPAPVEEKQVETVQEEQKNDKVIIPGVNDRQLVIDTATDVLMSYHNAITSKNYQAAYNLLDEGMHNKFGGYSGWYKQHKGVLESGTANLKVSRAWPNCVEFEYTAVSQLKLSDGKVYEHRGSGFAQVKQEGDTWKIAKIIDTNAY